MSSVCGWENSFLNFVSAYYFAIHSISLVRSVCFNVVCFFALATSFNVAAYFHITRTHSVCMQCINVCYYVWFSTVLSTLALFRINVNFSALHCCCDFLTSVRRCLASWFSLCKQQQQHNVHAIEVRVRELRAFSPFAHTLYIKCKRHERATYINTYVYISNSIQCISGITLQKENVLMFYPCLRFDRNNHNQNRYYCNSAIAKYNVRYGNMVFNIRFCCFHRHDFSCVVFFLWHFSCLSYCLAGVLMVLNQQNNTMTLDQQNLRNFFTHHNLSTTKNHRFFSTYCKLYGDDEDDDDDDDGDTCLRLISIHCVHTWLYARVQKFEKSGEVSHILLHLYTHMTFFLLLAPMYLNTRYYRQSAYVAVL